MHTLCREIICSGLSKTWEHKCVIFIFSSPSRSRMTCSHWNYGGPEVAAGPRWTSRPYHTWHVMHKGTDWGVVEGDAFFQCSCRRSFFSITGPGSVIPKTQSGCYFLTRGLRTFLNYSTCSRILKVMLWTEMIEFSNRICLSLSEQYNNCAFVK